MAVQVVVSVASVQRCHWNEPSVYGPPTHVPGSSVRVLPVVAVPLSDGATVAAGGPVTAAVTEVTSWQSATGCTRRRRSPSPRRA